MNDSRYRPIHTSCIHPEHFPQVDLYMQSGHNMVLYKPGNRTLSSTDMGRLQENRTQYLYVSAANARAVADFLEEGIAPLMLEDALSDEVKGQLLVQVGMNYLMDIFEMPDKLSDIKRCRTIVSHLVNYILKTENAINHLHGVVNYDFYTFAHSVHVAALSIFIHSELFNLSYNDLEEIGIGGILHDIGMIFVPRGILDKTDLLSSFEYSLIKKHAELGYECLHNLGGFSNVSLAAVRYHHERNNGEGYPFSLAGDEIPRTGQVTAICDVFSALTSNRAYKRAILPGEAISLMESVGKDVFSQGLLERFKELVLTPELPEAEEPDEAAPDEAEGWSAADTETDTEEQER